MQSPAHRTRDSHMRGVTFVELLVTLAIFTAVTTVLLGSFLALFSVREQTSVAQEANDDIRVVLDGIEREIQAGNDIEASGDRIRFTVSSRGDQEPYQVQYKKEGTTIWKAVQRNIPGDPCATVGAGGDLPNSCFLPITGDNVEISVLNFSIVRSEELQEQASPLVTLSLSGVVRDSSDNVAPLNHSTSITPRNRVTVSDVEPAPPSPAPIATLVNIGNHLPAGCRVSEQAYWPIDAPETPPDSVFYTNCSQINLMFTVNPGSAGLHSLRYTAPGSSAIKYGTGETGDITLNFNQDSGEARRLVVNPGPNRVRFSAENLYGDRYSGMFDVERIGGTQCWNWIDDDGDDDGRDYAGLDPDLDCSSLADNDEDTATPPSVTIGVANPNLTAGQSTTLTWSSTDTTTCTASGAWVGLKGTSGGPQSTGVLPAGTYTYTLTCTGPGGSDSDDAVVVVGAVGGTCTIGPLQMPEPLEICVTTEVQDFFGLPPYQACPPEGSVVPLANFPSGMCIDHTTPGPGACYTTYHYRLCGGAMVNTAPSANAGPDQNWSAGTVSTTLAGSGTDTEGGALTYLWLKDSGPAVTISGAGTPNPTISGLADGSTYVFRVRVTDTGGLWDEDTVTVTVGTLAPTGVWIKYQQMINNHAFCATTDSSWTTQPCTVDGEQRNFTVYQALGCSTFRYECEFGSDYIQCAHYSGLCDDSNNSLTAPVDMGDRNDTAWINPCPAPRPIQHYMFGQGRWASEGAVCGMSVNNPPTVNAGPDQTLPSTSASTPLAGSGTDPDGGALTYLWSQVSGPGVTFSSTGIPNPTVSGLVNGSTYVFRLRVTDTGGLWDEDTVTVSVSAPVAVCLATVKTWGGAPLCSAMVPNTSAGSSFTATDGAPDPQGSAVYTCLAGGIWSGPSGATCASAVNTPPNVNAGPDQTLPAGTVSTSLAGSGGDAEGPITYSWSRIAGPAMTFANPSLPNTSVSGLTNGSSYTFRLTVTDSGGLQRSDDVTVSVGAGAPTCTLSEVFGPYGEDSTQACAGGMTCMAEDMGEFLSMASCDPTWVTGQQLDPSSPRFDYAGRCLVSLRCISSCRSVAEYRECL